MPKVGGKKFPYTAKGMKAARKEAKEDKMPMQMMKKHMKGGKK